ncbi:efflux RND transporter periplasmic adaptor subunit [Phaeobacter sp. NW0010-22]|uniref:efflux RND transporter periplasmic adaptor subunit n=1 Tax=Phaeobacter sp. NW0010-22 TaxID=3135907 RepID=UPI0031096701
MTDPKPRGRWKWLLTAIVILGGVLVFLDELEDTADIAEAVKPPTLPLVSVISAQSSSHAGKVHGFAEIKPRWSATLSAAVSGRIIEVSDHSLAGEQVKQGDSLIRIEDSNFRFNLAQAQQRLSEAELALVQAKNKSEVARKQIARGKTIEATDLALHLPQMRIAEHALAASKVQVEAAREQLRSTVITAPFSGFVTKRDVSPGQTVTAGQALLSLVDDQRFDLEVSLGDADWMLLSKPWDRHTAKLFSQTDQFLGTARIRRGGGFLDAQTRQRKLFLEVVEAKPGLIQPGAFVKVELIGREIEQTLRLPESTLTREGDIWYVDPENRLRRFKADISYREGAHVVVRAPETSTTLDVVRNPLGSFLPGLQVSPRKVEDQ